MWAHIVHVVTHWSWSTIAAFAAAVAALAVARSQTRERRQMLGSQIVVDVGAESLIWHRAAGAFLRSVTQHFQGQMSANDLNREPVAQVTAAIAGMDSVLKRARMACNDFELLYRIAEAESRLGAFAERLQRPTEESLEQQDRRLGRIFDDGRTDLQAFGAAIEAFQMRGFTVYSPRRGLRFRWQHRRFNRQVKAAESQNNRRTTPLGGE
jgi:hypothetical protein